MMSTATRVLCGIVLVVALEATAYAQATDVVEVTNGDRVTGEVRRLERGRLAFRMPAAGTLSINWAQVVRLTSLQSHDVELSTGERFEGPISSPAAGQLVVQTASGPTMPIALTQIIRIARLRDTFRSRTTGSIDFGLNYTLAENARTYTLEAEALNRTRSYETNVSFDSWLSARDDADRLSRNELDVDVHRLLARRWFAFVESKLQQDEPLELDIRFLAGGGVGRRLIQSNRSMLSVKGGVDYAAESYAGADATDHSAELLAAVDWDWFDVDSTTEASVTATTFVSLERQRARLDVDAKVRRDIFWDLYWAVNLFENFDSDPPDGRDRSAFGVSLSLGWSF